MRSSPSPQPRARVSDTTPRALRLADARKSAEYKEGDVIASKYRLARVLGEGGMGSVWLATNLTLEVDVALKLIRRGMWTEETASRLLQEARAAAQLEHASIVRVFDFGSTQHGDPFIVMELLRGESLAALIDRKGRLPASNAVRIVLPIASALVTAHDKGIIHRDLKPDNVFLCKSDAGVVPKVVDFGIAKLAHNPSKRRTRFGIVLGSPEYMAPEQARGEDIDGRSDVWSLAVVLYETITGHRPFDGPTYEAQVTAVATYQPPAITDFGVGDDALAAIVERGLAKEPSERWPSMRAFGAALAEWAVTRDIASDISAGKLSEIWLGEGVRSPSYAPPGDESGLVLVPEDMRAARLDARRREAETLPADRFSHNRIATAVDAIGAIDATPGSDAPRLSSAAKRARARWIRSAVLVVLFASVATMVPREQWTRVVPWLHATATTAGDVAQVVVNAATEEARQAELAGQATAPSQPEPPAASAAQSASANRPAGAATTTAARPRSTTPMREQSPTSSVKRPQPTATSAKSAPTAAAAKPAAKK
jgi:serine/threonine-protein kinase